MSQTVKYLTPKKTLSEIARERAEQAQLQNIDIYEAIAGLYEELAGAYEQIDALTGRIAKLEGGKSK